jgi:hypothetical protein
MTPEIKRSIVPCPLEAVLADNMSAHDGSLSDLEIQWRHTTIVDIRQENRNTLAARSKRSTSGTKMTWRKMLAKTEPPFLLA